MSDTIETRLQALGLDLPNAPAPAANYVPSLVAGNLLFVSGQLPMENGAVAVKGTLGDGVALEDGVRAARLCLLNVLAQAKAALEGDLGRIARCVKLGGFVASTAGFTDHPKVVNGASDLLVEVMGDAGRHTRFAVGVAALPLGAAVEVEAMFLLR